MPLAKCFINGQSQFQLDVEDRAIHYGDGLFETMLYQHGSIDLWKQHYARLTAGCRVLKIPVLSEETLLNDINVLTKELPNEHYLIKLIISRGAAGRGLFVNPSISSSCILLAYDFDVKANNVRAAKHLKVCHTRLMMNKTLGGIKHLNRLNYVLAAEELSTQYTEGVMLNDRNEMVECITHNLFFVQGKTLFTAPVDECGVAGIKRAQVIQTARNLGISVNIEAIMLDDLNQMDECFITNAVIGLQSVASINDVLFKRHSMLKQLQIKLNK